MPTLYLESTEGVLLCKTILEDHANLPGLTVALHILAARYTTPAPLEEWVTLFWKFGQLTKYLGIDPNSQKDNKQNPVVATVKITLRCRRRDQSQLMTYISHDGTVASAALLRPHHPTTCSKKGCPIILALSGVGVSVANNGCLHPFTGIVLTMKVSFFLFSLPLRSNQ